MLIKNTLVASSLVLSSIAFSAPKEVVNRGKVLSQNSKISMLDLGDNRQLKAAGVQKNDVLLSVCDTPIADGASFRKADDKLQLADTCEVKVERGNAQLLLQYVKGS